MLQDVGHLQNAQTVVEDLSGSLAATGPGGAAFDSAASYHVAPVIIEVWSRPPPADGQGWEATIELPMSCDSGQVRLWTTELGPAGEEIDLDGPGQYRLRVACRGRRAARRMFEEPLFSDVEHWRLQLWKTGPLDHSPRLRST